MPTRSQAHKLRMQGLTSEGIFPPVTIPNPLVDQTSTSGVADSYQFAANTFLVADDGLPLRYEIRSVVGGVEQAPLAGITFTEATRTLNWTLTGAGTRVVRVYATNRYGNKASDDFNIVVS